MKREWDLIRNILIQSEAASSRLMIDDLDFEYDRHLVAEHLRIMAQEDLIEISEHLTRSDLDAVVIVRLTWSGHDLLDAMRSDARWDAARKVISSLGGITLSALQALLLKMLFNEAGLD